MKQIKFTKKQVLDAIVNEPLYFMPGQFIAKLDNGKECNVCAVGAVMRQCIPDVLREMTTLNPLTNRKMSNSVFGSRLCLDEVGFDPDQCIEDNIEEYLDRLFEQGNYLGALSTYFEFAGREPNATDISRRMDIYNFVYATFPDTFTVEI